jgi:hypothetical protein
LAAGFAIAKLEHGGSATSAASPSATQLPATPTQDARGQVQSGLSALDQAALRGVVREELQQALANHAPSAAPAATSSEGADPSPAPSQAAIDRFDNARSDVDQGIRTGTWTAANREKLHSVLTELSPEMREALIRPLIVAANEGRIHVETGGALF